MRTLSELSSEINIAYWRIKYAHQCGKIPEPAKVGGIRVYTDELVAIIKDYFGAKNNSSTYICMHNSKKLKKRIPNAIVENKKETNQ